MPQSKLGRVSMIIGIIALVLGALLWCSQIYAKHLLRNELRERAHSVGAEWVDQDSTVIHINLLRGNASIGTLNLDPVERLPGSFGIHGRFKKLEVNGVSYVNLLFGGAFSAKEVHVVGNAVRIGLPEPKSDTSNTSEDASSFFSSLGSLKLELKDLILTNSDSLELSLRAFYGTGQELRLETFADKDPSFDLSSGELVLLQATVQPFADSSMSFEALNWNVGEGSLKVSGLRFGVDDVMETAPTVGLERDVIAGVVEELYIAGIDLQGILRGQYHANSLRLVKSRIHVARDKLLRDQEYRYKALPARLIRGLPQGSGVDSILVQDMDVDYYERVDAERGFGHIPFRAIHGELLDALNMNDAVLTLTATATVFDGTPVSLELNSAILDTLDAMHVKASIGELSFATLRQAIAPLTGVTIPEGHLDTLIMVMNGRDRKGEGRIWMSYEDLKLEGRGKREKLLDPIVDALLNIVVKKDRSNEREAEGWTTYDFERRRDRAVFNYLWTGVREGAKASMVSGSVKAVL